MKISRIVVYGSCLVLAVFVGYTYRHLIVHELLESKEVVFDPEREHVVLLSPKWSEADWPCWRGQFTDNTVKLKTSVFTPSEENTVWKSNIPGRGHGAPIVVGNQIFLQSANEGEKTQNLLSFDLETGKLKWTTELHSGNFDGNTHYDNTHASSTPACDGDRVFTTFLNDQSIWLSAVSMTGEQLWQTRCGRFVSKHGYGSSPCLFGSLVFVVADHEEGGFVAAIHRESGDVIWKRPRSAADSNSSPVALNLAGRDQLLVSGSKDEFSYNPKTGAPLWSFESQSNSAVATAVPCGEFVLASNGFRGAETVCVRADGSAEVVWRQTMRCHIPSLLHVNGAVYAVSDDGVAFCVDLKSGEVHWKERLSSNFSASPLLVGETILACSERGHIVTFRASTKKFEQLSEFKYDDEIYASPIVAGGNVLLRAANTVNEMRRETLYCFNTEN